MNNGVISKTVRKNARLGEAYTEILHASGLKILVYPKKCSSVYAILEVGIGSLDQYYLDTDKNELSMPAGTAHYLEHKMFENSDGVNSDMRFSALGADANAFTTYDRTAYLFNTTGSVSACLGELFRLVLQPYFTEESVDRERGIIAEEIRGASDHPWERAYVQLLKGMYERNAVRTEIAGSEQSIAQVTPALLYRCTDTFYVPSNMTLAICGDVSAAAVLRVVNRYFPQSESPVLFSRKQYAEPARVCSSRMTSYMPVPKPIFYIGLKDTDISDDPQQRLVKDACMTLLFELLFSMSGRLCSDMFENDRIAYGLYYGYSICSRVAFGTVSGESDDPEGVFAGVLEYIEQLKGDGIPRADFERCRRVCYGNFVAEFDSPENIVNMLLSFSDDDSEMLSYAELVQSLTLEQVTEYLHKCFRPEYMCLSVVYPEQYQKEE